MKVLQVRANTDGNGLAPEAYCLELTGEAVERLSRAVAAVQALSNLPSDFSHIAVHFDGLGSWRYLEDLSAPVLIGEMDLLPGRLSQSVEGTQVLVSASDLVFTGYNGWEVYTDPVPLSALSEILASSPDPQATYIQAKGLICPSCSSKEIDTFSPRWFSGDLGSQWHYCCICHAKWLEETEVVLRGFSQLKVQANHEKA